MEKKPVKFKRKEYENWSKRQTRFWKSVMLQRLLQ